jgi:membrane protein DedA with SNARE-associated domain
MLCEGSPSPVYGYNNRVFDQLVDLISVAPWAYLIIFALAFLDAVIPLFPSETAVITGGVLAGEGKISLALVIVFGTVGAVLGDNLAYLLGRHFREPIHRRFFKSEKAKERIGWAERQLDERGGELIITARFIPGGRLVVTFSAGGLGFPWRRFIVFDVIAGLIWATYASLLGYFGGSTFEHSTWKALALAFGIAAAITGGIELVRWLRRRRKLAK